MEGMILNRIDVYKRQQQAQLAGYTKKHAEEMASFSTVEHKAALAQRRCV